MKSLSMRSLVMKSLIGLAVLALLPACSGDSQAAEPGSAAEAWEDARAAALETLGHVRDGLSQSLDDARGEWEQHRGEWGAKLDQELIKMAEAVERLGREGRDKAGVAAAELKAARAELAELLERGGHAAAEEWVEQSEALRARLEKLERRMNKMAQPETGPGTPLK